jgi:hypothetical protein
MKLPLLAAALVAFTGGGGVPPAALGGGVEESKLRALAERCGSQIAWLRDVAPTNDGGAAFVYERGGKQVRADELRRTDLPPKELQAKIDEALARAKSGKRLVLWHVYRFEGGQMYRAPLLDDYMDQVVWSDPEVVELVTRRFVPLRTQCPKEIGKPLGLVAWDRVEPALVFLTPDGKVAHVVDRIRTFDPRWFAEVLKRVLAAHPDLDPGDDEPPAAAAFATPDGALLETTRRSYYDGLKAFLERDEKSALARWQELVESAPESPFAWRAAANLLPSVDKTWAGAARHAFEWPFESWLPASPAIPVDTRWRRKPEDATSVAENGVRWLLKMQRADGSWNDCRYAYWESPIITPNAWMAITALSAAALCDWRDVAPEEVDEALGRAEAYLFGDGRVNAGKNEECYAEAYRLLYLERALRQTEDPAQRDELMAKAAARVEQLSKLQSPAGQWAHEYDNAFASAVILEGFARAKRLGIAPPELALKRGLDALVAARFEDGSFVYGGKLPPTAKPGQDSLKDSCGRMPLCEAALFTFDRSDAKKLAKALSVYEQYYDRFEKISKCDFHTDGELGGFFFFHDMYHASEAILALPAAGQASYRQFLLEKITSLPEIDGSFLDDHELGKSCSTAFALLALKNVVEAPR